MKKIILYFVLFFQLAIEMANGQDPHFTQFYSAPFTVNPAYAGAFEGQARIITNYRQQWNNLAAPFVTGALGMDVKIGNTGRQGQNSINIGAHLMNDRSMNGMLRSNYAGILASYHVSLDQDGYHTLGAGLSATYGSRNLDYSQVSFDQQFASGGFDINLPSGEAALQNMKPFVSVGTGILYRYDNQDAGDFVEFGLSGFHFNRPKQTFLNDPNAFLPIRVSAQASYQKYVNENTLINLKALYQNQAQVEYLLAGFSIAKTFGLKYNLIGIGAWYRTGDAVSPYLFCEYNNVHLGITYDLTMSDLRKTKRPSSSMEFSLMWKIKKSY